MPRTSGDLEILQQTLVFESGSDARDFKDLFRRVAEQLSTNEIVFAIIGRLAMNFYCEAQFTDNISILVVNTDRIIQNNIRKFYIKNHNACRRANCSVALKLDFTDNSDELDLVNQIKPSLWMDSMVKVADPEYLLLNCLRSGSLDDCADAINLIRAGVVDLQRAKALIGRFHLGSSEVLEAIVWKAAHEASDSYSKSVAKRMHEYNIVGKVAGQAPKRIGA